MSSADQTLEQVCEELLLLPEGELSDGDLRFVRKAAAALRDGYFLGSSMWGRLSNLHNRATAPAICKHMRGTDCALHSKQRGITVPCAFVGVVKACDDYVYLFSKEQSK